ncbi:hypothetical protein [Thioalkalivibrio sp. HL-Eb18]|uniref:hypothetical protein n=1 Tax=Thioalkalivibrio sp. HL-Eb18 TaxID=1266913 RepID=UPI000371C800|nr:hypothetical protein [Thioalkalivibrio sp. HL-Eb18]
MIRAILDSLKWSGRLGAKFFWAVPVATGTVVIATVVSQVALLLAFFLPLKVIILLGSDGIPRYFPPAFAQVERDHLILWLTMATVAFYLLYLIAERVVEWGSQQGATRLLARSRKMVLFEGQDGVASRSYKRFASVLAGGVFFVLAIALMVWLYPAVAVLIVGYSSIVTLALVVGLIASRRFREHLKQALSRWTTVLAAVGFMLAFGYLVVDFLFRQPPGLIPAIIALLMSRQAFNRLGSLVPSLLQLYQQRPKLDALFFHRSAYHPPTLPQGESVLDLLFPEERAQWIPVVLHDLAEESSTADVVVRWQELMVSGVFALRCEVAGGGTYLVKIFEDKSVGQARHEAALLSAAPRELPAPGWVGATSVRGYRCHVLKLDDGQGSTAQNPQSLLLDVRTRLLQLLPGKAMVAQYGRSRARLWQRMDAPLLDSLRIATDGCSEEHLRALVERLPEWQEHLRNAPMVFHNPDLKPATVIATQDGAGVALHWGRWAMEPAGVGWPASSKGSEDLKHAAEVIRNGDSLLQNVSDITLDLAALTADLERDLKAKHYLDATRKLKPIRDSLDQLERAGNESR